MRNVTALALVRNIHEARCACAWLDFLRKTNKKPAGDIVCRTENLAALNFRRFQPIQAIINLNQHHQLVANTSLVTNISLKQPHIIGSPQNLDAQVTTQHTHNELLITTETTNILGPLTALFISQMWIIRRMIHISVIHSNLDALSYRLAA